MHPTPNICLYLSVSLSLCLSVSQSLCMCVKGISMYLAEVISNLRPPQSGTTSSWDKVIAGPMRIDKNQLV